MLRIDKGNDASHGLSLRKDLEGKGGLTRGLRTVNLNDATTRNAADAKRGVKGN